jgi:thioesterase domain-containing protein/acyl carrier protein
LLEINAQVIDGQLRIHWSYSCHCHRSDTVQRLAEYYRACLQALIAHCLAVETPGNTPSDFPLARLDQAALDGVIARANGVGQGGNGVADLYPLSPMQELMLVYAVSTPQADTLLTQIRYTLKGELDVQAFQSAWQRLVDRHTALRTAFLWEESLTPLQIVYRQAQLPFVYQDLRSLPASGRQVRCRAIRQNDQARGFNLSEPPLMRITLIQLEEDEYELIWTSHHLVLDRWCIDIAVQELSEHYAIGDREGKATPAPSFRNYSAWIQQQDMQAAEQFWRERLAGCTGPTPLGLDTPLAPYTTEPPSYMETQIDVPAKTLAALHSVAHHHHLTLNTLLQGAWAVLLSRYSQEPDVLFGVAVSGRPPELAGVEATMGSFVNNLPVRVSISSDRLIPWLKALQEQQVNTHPYAYTSLARIQEWSDIPQRMPLFETLLVYQSPTGARPALTEHLQIRALPGRLRTNYPLTILATDTGDGLSIGFIYDIRRFASDTITGMMNDLTTLLAEFSTNSDRALSGLCDLPQAGQQRSTDLRHVQVNSAGRNGHAVALPADARPRGIVAPRDVLEHQLVKIWEQILAVEPIGIRDNFFALGGHSLLAIRMFSYIETAFGKKLPATLLSQAATIEQLAEVMRREETASLRPLVAIQSSGSGRPLFYISPPGENMLSFAYFVHHLGADRPCYGLQPLGLNGEEAPYTRAEDMAAHFIREMQGIQPQGPYLLTGTCFGGMVAVEMARQLQAQGQRVAFLALFDTPFPNPTLWSKIRWHLLSLGKLEPSEMTNYILERVKRRAAKVVGRFYIKRKQVMPAHVRDLYAQAGVAQAVNTYIPQQYQGKITLFSAEGGLVSSNAKNRGWHSIATNGVDVYTVPGEHGTMMSEPHVHVLVRQFQACLAQVQADEGWQGMYEPTAKEVR